MVGHWALCQYGRINFSTVLQMPVVTRPAVIDDGLTVKEMATHKPARTPDMKTVKTTIHRGTWLNQPGVSTTYQLSSRPTGLRVHLLEMEGKPAEVSLVTGDGTKGTLVVLAAGQL